MKTSTLVFVENGNQILLAMKKRGFGQGKWNGYGGKVEDGESIKEAACREFAEESGINTPTSLLSQKALIDFFFEDELVFVCHIFTCPLQKEIPRETEEMRPAWYSKDALPLDQMWAADKIWLPMILAGQKIKATVQFNKDGSKVKSFSYQQHDF